ncbi:MAG: hypothetical protein OXD47_11060 [Gammaproteobacteria bacterium]|nr:hypothetical protein [Gammaproteobacteria bacterium]
MNTVAEQKKIVSDFIRRCNDYADAQISKYTARLQQAQDLDALALETQIYNWKVYKAFNAHAIEELQTTELDDWFAE